MFTEHAQAIDNKPSTWASSPHSDLKPLNLQLSDELSAKMTLTLHHNFDISHCNVSHNTAFRNAGCASIQTAPSACQRNGPFQTTEPLSYGLGSSCTSLSSILIS